MVLFNIDPQFLGAFLGAFFSFLFYILAYYLPKWVKKLGSLFKTRKKLHRLYDILLSERDIKSAYELIKLFSFEGIRDILRGGVHTDGTILEFNNESWKIVIINKMTEGRITIFNSDREIYHISVGSEGNIQVLLKFLHYLEFISKQKKYTIKPNKKRKEAKLQIEKMSSEEEEKRLVPKKSRAEAVEL